MSEKDDWDELAGRDVAPWEAQPAEAEPCLRHDAFNGVRKRRFLEALAKTGFVAASARAAGVSAQTVYNHMARDAEFSRFCELARGMAGTTAELVAWERAVVGVEEDVWSGGKHVGTRMRRSDSLLRLLLQGAKRKKYGPRPGFSRKRLMKHERKQMEREIRAAIAAEEPSIEQVRDEVRSKLAAITAHRDRERLATGWTRLDGGDWIPPGWVRADEGVPPVGDSM